MVRSELLAARLALGFRTLLSSLPLLHGVDRPHGLCDGQPFSSSAASRSRRSAMAQSMISSGVMSVAAVGASPAPRSHTRSSA